MKIMCSSMQGLRLWLMGLWLSCGLLAACGGAAPDTATPAATKKSVATASNNSSAGTPERIKAVITSQGMAPVAVSFELTARPALNQPLDIKLYLLGSADVTEVQLSIKSDAPVTIVTGAQASFAALKNGQSIEHVITVSATDAGLATVDVQFTGTVDGHPQTATFAIPLAFAPAKAS